MAQHQRDPRKTTLKYPQWVLTAWLKPVKIGNWNWKSLMQHPSKAKV